MTKKMKMLIICEMYPYPPYKNGVCNTIYNFLSTEELANYEVTFLHFESEFCKENSIQNVNANVIYQKIIGTEFTCKLNNKRILKPRGMIHIDSRKMEILDVSEYEIVLFASIIDTCIYDKLINKDECKMILFEADSPAMFYDREMRIAKNPIRRLYNRLQMFLVSNYEKKLANIMDRIFFVSDVDRKYVSNYIGEAKTRTAKIGVKYIDIKQEHRIGKTIKIGFSGKMDYKPNYLASNYIINDIMPALNNLQVSYEIYLIGNKPAEEWIDMARNDKRLIVTGFLDDIQSYIADMDIYISPLFIGSGMKNKILEALSIGIPVIASDVSVDGIDGMIHETNYIHCDKNATNWANKIVELYNDVEKRIAISKKGKELIKSQYSWERFAKDLLDE